MKTRCYRHVAIPSRPIAFSCLNGICVSFRISQIHVLKGSV